MTVNEIKRGKFCDLPFPAILAQLAIASLDAWTCAVRPSGVKMPVKTR